MREGEKKKIVDSKSKNHDDKKKKGMENKLFTRWSTGGSLSGACVSCLSHSYCISGETRFRQKEQNHSPLRGRRGLDDKLQMRGGPQVGKDARKSGRAGGGGGWVIGNGRGEKEGWKKGTMERKMNGRI